MLNEVDKPPSKWSRMQMRGGTFIEAGVRSQDDAVFVFALNLLCWGGFQRRHDGL